MPYFLFLFALLFFSNESFTQEVLPFQDPQLALEIRVKDLVSRLNNDEKLAQLMNNAPAIERLKIPAYNWWNECLHGVARNGKATVFPQAIGLAASWDTSLIYRISTAISDEARAKYNIAIQNNKHGIYQGLSFWSPNINIFRDPRWGRGMETWGEDPHLTGRMAVQFVKGLQGNDSKYLKTIATPKHFAVHSGPEAERHWFAVRVSEKDLRETYLPAFKTCITEGHAASIMCAYNRLQSRPCCGSDSLLNTILRNEWKFKGYVVTDCDAVYNIHILHKYTQTGEEAAALALNAGTDLNCGSHFKYLPAALEKGLTNWAKVDTALSRLFRARFLLGMFDPESMNPWSGLSADVVDCEQHRELALEAAQKSIVLLKNENNLLPLKKEIKTLAVIGPNAHEVDVLLGNYNGMPTTPVTPLDGIRNKLKETKILYSRGCDLAPGLPTMVPVPASALYVAWEAGELPGIIGEYYDNRDFSGEAWKRVIDTTLDFNWWDDAPVPHFDPDNFGIRWTGYLIPPVSGKYALGGEGFNSFRIFIDDSLLVHFSGEHESQKVYKWIELEKGRAYRLKVEFMEESRYAFFRLLWAPPESDLMDEAVKIARKADVVVLCMGLSPRLEGEELNIKVEGFHKGDRLTLELPKVQQELIKAISAIGKPIVLVLLNGSALAINFEKEHIPAIVEAWYPGQAGGTAIADVLFGDFNPCGKLPVTFYKDTTQLPPFDDYSMTGRTYRFLKQEPLYPFGYGLSFTQFKITDAKAIKPKAKNEAMHVMAKLLHTSGPDGEVVLQLYLINDDEHKLIAFTKLKINQGRSSELAFDIPAVRWSELMKNSKGKNPKLIIGTDSNWKNPLNIEIKL